MGDSSSNDEIIVNSFTEESAKDFRKKVIARAMADHNAPIVIMIDSYGGFIDALNCMLETIEQVPNPIVTVCIGKAMSCGAILLAAGDYRFCGRRSRIMVHQGSSGTGGPIESMQNDVTEVKRLNKELMTFIAKRCGMSLKEFKIEMKKQLVKGDDEARDMYLPAAAAKELGIVEHIGMPLIKPAVIYQIECSSERKYESSDAELEKKAKKVAERKAKKKVAKKKTKKKSTKKK